MKYYLEKIEDNFLNCLVMYELKLTDTEDFRTTFIELDVDFDLMEMIDGDDIVNYNLQEVKKFIEIIKNDICIDCY